MTTGPHPAAAPPEPEWAELAPQTITVTAAAWATGALAVGIPTGIGVATRPGGLTSGWVLAAVAFVVGAGTTYAYLRWRTARYRIGPARVELRAGVLLRVRRSLPLDAVRSVDTDAGPLQRRFGLVVVRIGTGGRDGAPAATLTLNAVTSQEGERLHGLLLERIRSAGGLSVDAGHGRLASVDARWARYAPFSVVTPVLGCLLVGVAVLGLLLAGVDVGATLAGEAGLPAALTVLVLVLAVAVVGAGAAVALFAERWWNYRLDREPGGTLRVRRGLVAVRSAALEEGRLTGVVVDEPLGARLLGAGRLRAVCAAPTSGGVRADGATVLPTAPLALAHRLAAVLLGVRRSPTAAPLCPHPEQARRRRERRAAVVTGVPAVVLAVVGGVTGSVTLLAVAAGLVVVAVPAAVLAARHAFRNLGHGVTDDDYLVTRSGLLRRRTAAVRCDAVTGWTATRTPLQRRDGLLTVTATTTAGPVRAWDVGESDGLLLASAATPDLVDPLLEPVPER